MSGSAKATTNHDEIRQWVEDRGGFPACVCGAGGKEDTGMIRIDFPGYSGSESLKRISWDDWFEKFEEKNLAFLHQDEKDGKQSRFSKLVSR
jgi:hypothetical protein